MWILAWRNLWRNKGRTLILAGAVTWTFALFLITLGIQDDQHGQMGREAARGVGGDVLVHAEGWWDVQTGDLVVQDPDALVATIAAVPGVEHVVPRVLSNGLAQSARESAGLRLMGIDPTRQAQVDDPARYLVEGDFLDANHEAPLVLGAPIVEDLPLRLGDRVVWMASGPNGEVQRALFRLTGILDSGSDARDRMTAYTTIAAAQNALGLHSAVVQLGATLAPQADQDQVANAIRAALGAHDQPLEVLTWQEAMPDMVGFLRIDAISNTLYMLVLFVVVGFGIANTFLMVLLERVRELGLLGALGLTPWGISRLVLIEFTLLVTLSMLAGLCFGYLGHRIIAEVGIDLRQISGNLEVGGVQMDGMILRSRVHLANWVAAAGAVGGMALIAALYPAIRASRLDPAEAMRSWG